jgi:hypothetical protein
MRHRRSITAVRPSVVSESGSRGQAFVDVEVVICPTGQAASGFDDDHQ